MLHESKLSIIHQMLINLKDCTVKTQTDTDPKHCECVSSGGIMKHQCRTLAVSRAAPWWVTLSISRQDSGTDGRMDARPLHYAFH